ncbi:MAG: hypothetical protein SH850_19200 [Planctomycetaceae bacterium]|nr:hypothetical protein [Planctomycetaceae bacterium]
MVATAAIATYVRSLLLYGHGPWADGIVEWLSQTLIGYFGLVLLSVPIIVFESWKTRFFGFDRERTPGEIVVDVCVALLALCALLWIAHAHHRL